MADNQTKFTLSEDARCYLEWLAQEVLFVKTGNEAAKHLVVRQIEVMRREHRQFDPPMSEIKRVAANVIPDGDGDD